MPKSQLRELTTALEDAIREHTLLLERKNPSFAKGSIGQACDAVVSARRALWRYIAAACPPLDAPELGEEDAA